MAIGMECMHFAYEKDMNLGDAGVESCGLKVLPSNFKLKLTHQWNSEKSWGIQTVISLGGSALMGGISKLINGLKRSTWAPLPFHLLYHMRTVFPPKRAATRCHHGSTDQVHQPPSLLVPGLWTTQPPEPQEVNFYCLSMTEFKVFCYSSVQWPETIMFLFFCNYDYCLCYYNVFELNPMLINISTLLWSLLSSYLPTFYWSLLFYQMSTQVPLFQ